MGKKSEQLKQFKRIERVLMKKRDVKQHNSNRKMLNKAFEKDVVICHWCKEYVKRADNRVAKNKDATVDHIYEKLDLRRLLVTEKENTVISCYDCNQRRANDNKIIRKYSFERNEIINIISLIK